LPIWAMPVVAALPFWAMLYAGSFGERASGEETPVTRGAAIYTGQGCGGCHGPNGQGGVGPAMTDVVQTFPNFDDHVAWVKNGSTSVKGQPYGETGKIATGGMPGFALSDEDLNAVVCYERVQFAREDPVPPQCEAGAEPDAGEGSGAGEETDSGSDGDVGVTAGGEGGG
ncbi:MAG TPA: cytochrome c, partial [Acidimicrobiales bacterium]|nr:cytochrome c [Acidimicrobiales bacterium]